MSAIEGLRANGGTFTQGAVHRARELLEGGGNENKYIVFLSDGEPTYCNGIHSINGLSFDDIKGHKVISSDIDESNYNYSKIIGNGNSRYAKTGFAYNIIRSAYMDCGRAAINEAGFAKRDGVTMYTVGLQLGADGKSILEKMANKDKFIGVEDPDYLTNEFSKIASQIYNATNNASVNVNFQKGIELKTGVSVNDIDHEGGAVSIKDGKPVWELGTVDAPLEDGSEYKYAYIRFKVSVNDEILSTSNPKRTKLLGNINFTYKDKDGIEKNIPIKEDSEQEVKLYVLRKIIKDSTSIDNEHRIFKFKVIGDDYNKEYELKSSVIGTYKNCKILKDVKKNTRYQVYESEGALAYDETDNNHKVFNVKDYYNNSEIYMSNDLTQKGSKVEGALASGGVTPVANIHIDGQSDKFLTVENSEKKLLAKMTVNKIIKVKRSVSPTRSAKNTNLPKETSFSFSIKDGQTIIKNGEVKIGSDLKGSKTFEGLSFKEYTLHENEESIQPNTPFKPEQNDIKFKIYLYDVLNNKDKGKEINFVNEFDSEHNSASVDFTAHKIWVNGNKSDFDKVSFKLFRTVGGGTKEEVKNVTPTKVKKDDYKFDYKWSKLPKYNKDVKEYTYSVEEEGVSNGNVTINGNTYAVNQNGDTITNTYTIPKIDKFEAKKEWSVDPSMADKVTYPTMQFDLYRKTASVAEEKVVNAEPKEINKTNLTATWTNLDKTNKDGEVYTYYVKENFKENKMENDNWVLGKYDSSERKITNKLEDDKNKKGKLTVKKELLVNTNTQARTRRSISDPIKFKFKLTGPYSYKEEFELAPGEEKEFENLYFGEYKLEETDAKGYTPSYSENSGKVTLTRAAKDKNIKVTNTIDNTSNASTVSFKATKEWIGGPKNDHTAIKLNLMRKIDGGEKEVVVTNPIISKVENKNAFDYEWSKLPKYNENGKEYTYSVEEEGVSNNEVTINGNTYAVSQIDNTITNTYKIPKIDKFEAKKEWSVDPSMADKVTYPTMQFDLYRKTASVAEEKVVNAEPKEINKTNLTATWTNLDKTNKDGEVYTYYVKENFKENKIENDNWVLGQYNPSERKITNKLEDDKTKKGKLTIEKKFTNIPKYLENKVFDFEVQGPYGYRKTVQIKAGSKMEIDGLYYGNYTIKEVIPENALYKVSGSVEQNISLRKNEPANVLFTNILKDVSTINISVNKEWKGDGPTSSVKINLLINGKKTNKSLELNKNNNWKGEFVNLEKRDDNGDLITYSIAEEKINNYETAYSNNLVKNQDGKITVTNTYKKENNPYIPGNGNNKIIVDRIGGETRIETAVELSKKVDKSDTVIIANAYKFPDAMASAPLAYLKNGVILLTTGDKSKGVPKATINEIQRLKAKNIIVVGGNSSVSDEEVSALKKVAKNIKRIGGVDRYQTSELIAYEVNKLTDNKNKVVVASGEVFPDALSVGSYASRKGLAIILSKHNQLPLYSKQAIKNIGANDFIIVGGVNTISKSVEESINGKKVRYAGLDRYETAREIAENTYSNPNRVFIASGEIFIDSLVVGPVAGRFEAPILLTNKNSLPKPTKDFTMKSSVKHITIVGGVNTVSKKVENELNK